MIYDSVVHCSTIIELARKYGYNYSTIRHIILQYHLSGKIDQRKFKLCVCDVQSSKTSQRDVHASQVKSTSLLATDQIGTTQGLIRFPNNADKEANMQRSSHLESSPTNKVNIQGESHVNTGSTFSVEQ